MATSKAARLRLEINDAYLVDEPLQVKHHGSGFLYLLSSLVFQVAEEEMLFVSERRSR